VLQIYERRTTALDLSQEIFTYDFELFIIASLKKVYFKKCIFAHHYER